MMENVDSYGQPRTATTTIMSRSRAIGGIIRDIVGNTTAGIDGAVFTALPSL
jgi:hypothetical protein